MGVKKFYNWFYYSLLTGVLVWFVAYFVLPVEPLEKVKTKTLLFIVSCYTFLILGYWIVPRIKNTTVNYKTRKTKVFNILIVILLFAFVIRWIDLFLARGISFVLEPKENRLISANSFYKNNLIFIVASVLKSLYFFPFVFYITKSFTGLKRVHLVLSLIILLLPFIEGAALGSRKPFFDVLLVVVASLMLWRGNKLLSLKALGFILISILLTLVISATILFKRESPTIDNKTMFFNQILEAKYNDMLQPKEWIVSLIQNRDNNEYLRMGVLTSLQTGQYIAHGIFEFNHIIDKEVNTSFGAYTFYPILKLIRVMGGQSNFEPQNESPRRIVYLTAFGGFFLDFKWLSVLVFFVLGIIQKVVFNKSKRDSLYLPLVVYFLIINVFLPIFHYIRGAGVYPLFGFAIIATIILILENRLNEKSTST